MLRILTILSQGRIRSKIRSVIVEQSIGVSDLEVEWIDPRFAFREAELVLLRNIAQIPAMARLRKAFGGCASSFELLSNALSLFTLLILLCLAAMGSFWKLFKSNLQRSHKNL